MRFLATIRMALRALRRNKMRSVLTALGIIIGVGAVIAMVGIGNGAKAQVEARIASLGRNVIIVWAGNQTSGGVRSGWGSAPLTLDDCRSIASEIPGVTAVSPEAWAGGQLTAGNQNWSTRILGESPEYLEIREWPLAAGAMFTEQDVRSAAKVCIIGKTVATQLFGGDDPVGQIIRVRQVPFIVAGVLTPKGMSVIGSDQDDVLIAPYTSVMKRMLRTTYVRQINIQTASPDLQTPIQRQVEALLREHHHIVPGIKDDDFTVRNQQEIADMATETMKVMTALLLAIACVSLLVGGIGIMNIMLVSVTERTREIGIRMAVGARGGDILLQFLIEATTLSSIGGILGILLGVGGAEFLAWYKQWPTLVPAFWIIAAFLFSAAVGILFGLYPAWKASRLDPIEALRYE